MQATNLILMVLADLGSIEAEPGRLGELISPPLAFQEQQSTVEYKGHQEQKARLASPTRKLELAPTCQPSETQLTTCLTRTRRLQGGLSTSRKRTSLEQNILSGSQNESDMHQAFGTCRFKAQVAFESDTDSQSNSTSSSNMRPKKELVSQTKYAHADRSLSVPARSKLDLSSLAGKSGLQPDWDYSLRVNRLRGSEVDSKVR